MKKGLALAVVALIVISLSVNVYLFMSRPRLVYVRSHELVEKFAGTLEARTKFEQKKGVMMANVDSLKANFERERIAYLGAAEGMSASQRKTREETLGREHGQIMQYSTAVEEQIAQEDRDMMEPVLSQINTYVEEYAKEKGYDMILGTTLSGSLLYGNTAMDVTDDILAKLNAKYKGQ